MFDFDDVQAKAPATPQQVAKVQVVIDEIFREDYYVMKWDVVKHTKPLTGLTVEELLKPFQDFWSSLPDSKAARRFPYFLVCDLAESYCYDLIHDEADCRPIPQVDSPDDDPKSCYHC